MPDIGGKVDKDIHSCNVGEKESEHQTQSTLEWDVKGYGFQVLSREVEE